MERLVPFFFQKQDRAVPFCQEAAGNQAPKTRTQYNHIILIALRFHGSISVRPSPSPFGKGGKKRNLDKRFQFTICLVCRKRRRGSDKFDRLLLLLRFSDLTDDKRLFAKRMKPPQDVFDLFRSDDEDHSNPVVEGSKHFVFRNITLLP